MGKHSNEILARINHLEPDDRSRAHYDDGLRKYKALWSIRKREKFNTMTELDRPGWLLVAEKH